MRVLVADDEAISRRMLEHSLRRWGYEVVVAGDGLQALEILSRPDAPKLLLLDWMMPGMDGVEICREIRRQRRADYSYVLLLTSKQTQDDVVVGLESGADDYLTKPFDPQELQVRLRTGRRIIHLMDELVAAREALREQATHDALTGLWNRAAISEALDKELLRSQREGTSVGVVMFDVDHFKSINDTFGHPVGDEVLRAVGRTIGGVIRSYDFAGRYGGEEFLVILPGCDRLTAFSHAERVRKTLSRLVIPSKGGDVRFTASFGVTVADKNTSCTASAVVATADEALYAAKRGGRDRVVFASSEAVLVAQ